MLFALSSLLWLTLGSSRGFRPSTWEVNGGWVLGSIVLGFVEAYVGGRVCARLARDARGPTILIAIMIVLGVVSALLPVEEAKGPRPDDVSIFEATAGALQPTWQLAQTR